MRISYVCVKKLPNTFLEWVFFLEIGQYGCKKTEFYSDFRSEESSLKMHRKKLNPKQIFPGT
jgi:hypothetical protein